MSKILEEYGKEMYQEGFEEGLQEAAIEIAQKLMAHGKNVPFIAKTLKVEEAVVEEWLKEDEHRVVCEERKVWDTPGDGVEKKIKKNKENHTRDGVEKKK